MSVLRFSNVQSPAARRLFHLFGTLTKLFLITFPGSDEGRSRLILLCVLTLKVLVATIDAKWEGMGDVGSARYEPALLPSCPTISVLSYSN